MAWLGINGCDNIAQLSKYLQFGITTLHTQKAPEAFGIDPEKTVRWDTAWWR